MELDFSILRCNPTVAPIREKRLEENKRATVFPSFFRLQFWAKGAGHNSVTVCCKVLYPASGLPWVLACIWETLQGTHWYAETKWHCPSGEPFHSSSNTKEARQSRSHWDSLKDSGSFVLSVKRLSVQWPRNGDLSSNPCFYSNLICGTGNVTSLLIFSPAQYKVRPLTAMVPSSSGILGLSLL